jgi:PAS domain-containing protein
MPLAVRPAQAAARARSEAQLRVTLASIGDAVIATDDHNRVTLLNAFGHALTGWAEAVGRPLRDVFAIMNAQSRRHAENPFDRRPSRRTRPAASSCTECSVASEH